MLLAAAAISIAMASPTPAHAADISLSPRSLSFPTTFVGGSSSLTVTLTNVTSSRELDIRPAQGVPNSPHFSIAGLSACRVNQLPPGGSCSFSYVFAPQAAGQFSATAKVFFHGLGSTFHGAFDVSMTGTGRAPIQTTPEGTLVVASTVQVQSPPTAPPAEGAAQDPATPTTAPPTTAPGATTTTTSTTTAATTTTAPGGATATAGQEAEVAQVTSVPPPVAPLAVTISGPGQVVAQGSVAFSAGTVAWGHDQLDPSAWPLTFAAAPPTFLVADGPDALLVSAPDPVALLDTGEAVFVGAGATGSATPLFDGAFAQARRITLVANVGPTSFSPGEGKRDVNLIRAVLGPGETLGVTSSFPLLAVVADGAVIDAMTGTALPAGTVATAPSVNLRNDSTAPATVLVAAIGASVP